MNRNILVNLGEQRFDRLREEKKLYIDKTDFIREWWENSSIVTLIMRPRRFGKTLNMSMLECFFQTDTKAEEIYLRDFPFGVKNVTGSCKVHFR